MRYGRPYEWDAVLAPERGISHRSTTSSRLPGKAIEGSVSYRIGHLVPCVDCGSLRRDSSNPHSPHWRGSVQVDCAGRELS